MPRVARSESETMYYHIMTRGINREKIFKSDNDKKKILQILESKLNESECQLMAYCIMDNHMHLALKADKDALASYMKKINVSYAIYYNKKHNRFGHVFQDRFRSETILDESYLLGVIRYIHNNPVNAKMTKSPELYRWSSMTEYTNEESTLIGDSIREMILEEFGSKKSFMDFHKEEDKTRFLEIREEELESQDKMADGIISDYFNEKGVEDASQVKDKEDLIVRLIEQGLSYRKVAKLMDTSLYKVYQANKKNRP